MEQKGGTKRDKDRSMKKEWQERGRKSQESLYTQRKKTKMERVYLKKTLKSKIQRSVLVSTRVDLHCLGEGSHKENRKWCNKCHDGHLREEREREIER